MFELQHQIIRNKLKTPSQLKPESSSFNEKNDNNSRMSLDNDIYLNDSINNDGTDKSKIS